MQRKGTRKPNNANNATNTTVTYQAEQQEDVIIEDAMELHKLFSSWYSLNKIL